MLIRKSSSRSVGNEAENLATSFLKQKGYKILARNFYIRGGEIDIIAQDHDELVFVEVKARYNHKFGLPIESITPWKLKALQKSALFYIQKINWGNNPYRFDLVSIDYSLDRKSPAIELIKNII